jgi:DNA-binding NarL/FixJ family response regulator
VSGLRVLIADDHALVRSGIRMVLELFDGVRVVGEASNGRDALELVKELRPDVVILDIAMPQLGGLETAERIRSECPQVRVMVLSMHDGEEYVSRALRAGATGYLLKDAAPEELDWALRAVARGDVYLTPRVSKVVVGGYLQSAPSGREPLASLSPRQRQIFGLIAEGLTTKQIAARLGVSIKTIETHRAQLMERLGIRDIAGLVRLAVRTGVVRAED